MKKALIKPEWAASIGAVESLSPDVDLSVLGGLTIFLTDSGEWDEVAKEILMTSPSVIDLSFGENAVLTSLQNVRDAIHQKFSTEIDKQPLAVLLKKRQLEDQRITNDEPWFLPVSAVEIADKWVPTR